MLVWSKPPPCPVGSVGEAAELLSQLNLASPGKMRRGAKLSSPKRTEMPICQYNAASAAQGPQAHLPHPARKPLHQRGRHQHGSQPPAEGFQHGSSITFSHLLLITLREVEELSLDLGHRGGNLRYPGFPRVTQLVRDRLQTGSRVHQGPALGSSPIIPELVP